MNKLYKIIFVMVILFSTSLLAQHTVSGVVTDATTGDKLIGANVYFPDLNVGAATDANGSYSISVAPGKYDITCSFIGFDKITNEIDVNSDMTMNFAMKEYQFTLSVTVLADRVKERETPVAFTNISKRDMEFKLGSRDIPLVLNMTPSVYSTQQGGGAGDSRINVRGFNQRNVAIMINGVPINDMENGWVYWSNWDGISDATASIQMQRGLSAVNLATPSIGGTMNVITDPAAQNYGIFVKQEFAGGSFAKSSLFFNTGLVNEKWAMSGGIVRKTGAGIIDATWTDAWAYYFGAALNLGMNNRIEFYALGAPQRHGQNLYKQNIGVYSKEFAEGLDTYDPDAFDKYNEKGRLFNQNWAGVSPTYNGNQWLGDEIGNRYDQNFINERENFFHKPQVNLNWYSNLSKKLSLFTTVYYSGGHGGGTGTYGEIRTNSFEGSFNNETGKYYYYGSPWYRNWDETIAINQADSGTYYVDKSSFDKDDNQSIGILRNSRNNQYTVGAIAKAIIKLHENMNLTIGVDGRTAEIEHYREVRDLLGGTYFDPRAVDETLISDFWSGDDFNRKLGDKIAYDFTNNVNWIGGFAQFEYSSPVWTTYLTGAYSTVQYKHTNHFIDDGTGAQLVTDADAIGGYQFKGGLSHRFSSNVNVYINGGYIAKVPTFDAVINDQTGDLIDNPETENFLSGELGMNLVTSNRRFSANLNAYYTRWENRVVTVTDFDQLNGDEGLFVLTGMDQLHTGVELDFAWQPINVFRFDGAASFGNWVHQNDPTYIYKDYTAASDDSTGTVFANDLKVGDAPQMQFAIGGTLFPANGLSIMVAYKYYANFYADWNVTTRLDPDDRTQSWETPAYGLMDIHVYYALPLDLPGVKINLFAHVFNLLDTIYIQDATDNSKYNAHDKDHDADDAEVFFGIPRYINIGFGMEL